MQMLAKLQEAAGRIKHDTLTIYFAARDPRTPRAVRLLALLVAAYALSPIDLIPDFVPVLGYLDDLILIPLGVLLIIKLTPDAVIADSRKRARQVTARPTSNAAAIAIVVIWVLCASGLTCWLLRASGT